MALVTSLATERQKRRAKFPRGAVVALKSGGYIMTVRKVKDTPDGRTYECDYIDDEGGQAHAIYFEEQLKRYRETKNVGVPGAGGDAATNGGRAGG